MAVTILGLDPGLRHTGWGLISMRDNSFSFIEAGVISPQTEEQSMSHRLQSLFSTLRTLIERLTPQESAIEEVFMNKNPVSTLKLGMARGIALMTPSLFQVPVFEYSANKVKKTVVGAGHADKDQVQFMVRKILGKIPDDLKADATDALAVAICHGLHRKAIY